MWSHNLGHKQLAAFPSLWGTPLCHKLRMLPPYLGQDNVRQPKRCLHVSCGCGSNPTRRLNMAEHSTHLTLVPTQPTNPCELWVPARSIFCKQASWSSVKIITTTAFPLLFVRCSVPRFYPCDLFAIFLRSYFVSASLYCIAVIHCLV